MLLTKKKRWLGILTITLLAGLLIAFAVSDDEEQKPIDPDRAPQHIILGWSGNPTTSMSVVWRTRESSGVACGEIREASRDPQSLEAKVIRFGSLTEELVLDPKNAYYYHTVDFRDLKPGATYSYRVGSKSGMSEWNHFKTARIEPDPFEFIYLGDAQNEVLSKWSRTIRTSVLDSPQAAFILHAGDLINDANSDREWSEWFEAIGWVNRVIPAVATPGNHEYDRIKTLKNRVMGVREYKLSQFWNPQFSFPENGPAHLEETVYYFDYQGARFISLNSNDRIPEQTPWLESVLMGNPNRWTVVTMHHPQFATRDGREHSEIRDAWTPLFDRYGVDLVLAGHDHSYARSGKVYEKQTVSNDRPGTVYAVSVSGPKMYEINPEHSDIYQMFAGDTQLYQIIRIDGDVLTYESKTCVGEPNDSFELIKQEDGHTVLRDGRTESYPAFAEIAMQSH